MDSNTAPATTVRIMHFADVHLGVETHGKYNSETGLNTRLEDFTRALNLAIDAALEAGVHLALFAGDAYKSRDPNQTHQRAFATALRRLTVAGVPVVMLIGNHDIPNTRGRAHALEIYGMIGDAGVQIISTPSVERVQTSKGAVLVGGMPYLTRSRVLTQEESKNKTVEEVAQLIRERYTTYILQIGNTVEAHPDHIALLMGHFTVTDARIGTQGFLLNPNEPQVAVSNIALPVFDYVAMGHVHKMQNMNPDRQPPVVYCGSIDRIDFGERTEQKGFVLADVRKRFADWKHIPLKTRPFVEIEIDTKDADDPTEAMLREIARHPVADAIVKVTYKVSPEKLPLLRMDEVRQALGGAHLLVALSREMPPAQSLVRSNVLTESLTPEKALATYLGLQPRLAARQDELMAMARPLIDALEQEEALR